MRPYLRAGRAARDLNVGHELLTALLEDKRVDGFCVDACTGDPVWFIYTDELERLRALTGAAAPAQRRGKHRGE